MTLLASLPFAFADILPLVDYPGHLLRIHLLANWDKLPGHALFYQPAWTLIPNLALEAVTVPLSMVLPSTVVMRLFCVLVFVLLIYGGARLNRAVWGRWTAWSLAPALLVHNYIFAYGFLNFLFGIGVVLLGLALHIEHRDRPLAWRVVGELAVMMVLFFSHLMTLAIYVFAVGVLETASAFEGRPVAWRRLLREAILTGACLAIPFALLLLSPTRSEASALRYHGSKLAKVATVFQTGQQQWDYVFAIGLVSFVAVLLVTGRLKVNRAMAAVTLGLAVLFLASPRAFATTRNIDDRLPIVVLFAAFATFELRGRSNRMVATLIVGLLVFRVATTCVHYARSGGELDTLRRDFARLPAPALLFSIRQFDAALWQASGWNPPLLHGTDLAMLDAARFSGSLFTNPNQQPLVRTPAFEALGLRAVTVTPPERLDTYGARVVNRLDATKRSEPAYVFYIKGTEVPTSTDTLEIVVNRPRYAIYKVKR